MYFIAVCLVLMFATVSCVAPGQSGSDASGSSLRNTPEERVNVRFARVYGGADERSAPVIVRTPNASLAQQLAQNANGSSFVTIEFDVYSELPPRCAVQFVHCDMQWNETANNFINDILSLRTLAIDWQPLSPQSGFARFRGRVSAPNPTVQFRFAGNWKAKILDMDAPSRAPLAEVQFFVVDNHVATSLSLIGDVYAPRMRASPAALMLVLGVRSLGSEWHEGNVSGAVMYRNARWNEPFASFSSFATPFFPKPNPRFAMPPSTIAEEFGMVSANKQFRVRGVPAENDYRMLDLTSTIMFPPSNSMATRFARADIRRNGVYVYRSSDGVALAQNISRSFDDYVLVEFVLDPEATPSGRDVFLVGSFNNWTADNSWQMSWNEEARLFTLRRWIRRGVHSYAYATGDIHASRTSERALHFEEYEGNVVSAGHTFWGFVYGRNPAYGGYDAIIGAARASSINR